MLICMQRERENKSLNESVHEWDASQLVHSVHKFPCARLAVADAVLARLNIDDKSKVNTPREVTIPRKEKNILEMTERPPDLIN